MARSRIGRARISMQIPSIMVAAIIRFPFCARLGSTPRLARIIAGRLKSGARSFVVRRKQAQAWFLFQRLLRSILSWRNHGGDRVPSRAGRSSDSPVAQNQLARSSWVGCQVAQDDKKNAIRRVSNFKTRRVLLVLRCRFVSRFSYLSRLLLRAANS